MGRRAAPQPLTLHTPAPSTVSASKSDTSPGPLPPDEEDAPMTAGTAPPPVSSGSSLSGPDSRPPASQTPGGFAFTSRFAPRRLHNARDRPSTSTGASDQLRCGDTAIHDEPAPLFVSVDAALQPQLQDRAADGPQLPPRRHDQIDGSKKTRSGFFAFNKAIKPPPQPAAAHPRESRGRLSRVAGQAELGESTKRKNTSSAEDSPERSIASQPSQSNPSLSTVGDNEALSGPSSSRRSKPKSFALLGRSRSIRDKERSGSKDIVVPLPISVTSPELCSDSASPKTAPVSSQDRSFREMMASSDRNRSAERAQAVTREPNGPRESHREKEHRYQVSGLRENGGSTFLSGLRSSSTRAADMISKGLFGKSSRSGSTTERESTIDDEHYVLKVINLPLVEQTRKTRISKRLEQSRDKTEFWMPAFPWRAIDYLNYRGCEVEGLYRVPGSGPQVKRWQRRFDEEFDVNLFEQDDLYDINIIGSMLKAWLRELPDELFPKDAQDRVARECAGMEEVPQMLVDELSNLSPYNYYLLFAITCHLSLLLAHSERNKMDFRNLCICFQPCMKIDAYCFKFLVCNWRDCWKGCKTEEKYMEEEHRLLYLEHRTQLANSELAGRPDGTRRESGERNSPSAVAQEDLRPTSNKRTVSNSGSNESLRTHSSISTNWTGNSDREQERPQSKGRKETRKEMRPLSPIKPLSPLGF